MRPDSMGRKLKKRLTGRVAGFIFLAGLFLFATAIRLDAAEPPRQEYYELRIYHVENDVQTQRTEEYLKEFYLPALHQAGIRSVGVFKPIDTSVPGRIYVLIPYRNLDQFENLDSKIQRQGSASEAPSYSRMEKILLKAFSGMPVLAQPRLDLAKSERVYELRSYESATEPLLQNKISMFNEGGEIGIFERLGFNAVFYGEVLAGSKMPNLMYITAFAGMEERNKHWDTFRADPEWKALSAKEEFQNNVSHSDIILLKPTDYSDI